MQFSVGEPVGHVEGDEVFSSGGYGEVFAGTEFAGVVCYAVYVDDFSFACIGLGASFSGILYVGFERDECGVSNGFDGVAELLGGIEFVSIV